MCNRKKSKRKDDSERGWRKSWREEEDVGHKGEGGLCFQAAVASRHQSCEGLVMMSIREEYMVYTFKCLLTVVYLINK